MTYYPIIDLGSNSIRLVIYETKENIHPPYTSKDFFNVIDEKKIAGLSAYVQDGIFSKAGIKKACEVLKEHLRRVSFFDCEKTRIFATAVLRNCLNSKEATHTISETIGVPIKILSEHEEAHLGFVGAMCDRSIENGTLIDIGGGSTELTFVKNATEHGGISIPQGSVSSYAGYVNTILPTVDEMHEIEEAFKAHLAGHGNRKKTDSKSKHPQHKLADLSPYHSQSLYGIGGSPRATVRMYAAAFNNGSRPRSLTFKQIEEMLALLETDPHRFAHIATKSVPDRLHTLVPGCLIIVTLMRELGAKTLELCKYGVREGYLIERILEKNQKTTHKEA